MSPTTCVTVTARGSALGLGVQLHPDLDVRNSFQCTPRDALHQRLVVLAIAVGGRNFHAQLVACGFALELTLQARNQIARAVQIGERLASRGTVECLTGVVAQRVMDQDDSVLGDLHGEAYWLTGLLVSWQRRDPLLVWPSLQLAG